jgi:uncharacterized lipoprotein NlpE involved in copper resistance
MKTFMAIVGLLMLSGCSTGLMRDGGVVTNNFYVNAIPDQKLSAGSGGLLRADPGQSVTPEATTTSSVSSDRGSVTIYIRQGTSETTTAAGLNASLPSGLK